MQLWTLALGFYATDIMLQRYIVLLVCTSLIFVLDCICSCLTWIRTGRDSKQRNEFIVVLTFRLIVYITLAIAYIYTILRASDRMVLFCAVLGGDILIVCVFAYTMS